MLLPGLIREINYKDSNFLLLKLCQTSLVGLSIWSLFENCYCFYPWLLSEQDQRARLVLLFNIKYIYGIAESQCQLNITVKFQTDGLWGQTQQGAKLNTMFIRDLEPGTHN